MRPAAAYIAFVCTFLPNADAALLYYSRYTNKPWPCPNGQVWVPNVTSGVGVIFDDRQQHCKTVNGVFSCVNEKWTNTAPLSTHPWLVNFYNGYRTTNHPCDPSATSPKDFPQYVRSIRHQAYGLQNWPPPYEPTGKVLFIDCVSLKCTPAASGRQLGHSAAAAVGTAQPGWLPDPAATATDHCDMNTMVSASLMASEDWLAVVG